MKKSRKMGWEEGKVTRMEKRNARKLLLEKVEVRGNLEEERVDGKIEGQYQNRS
jgi:hypothetical protein